LTDFVPVAAITGAGLVACFGTAALIPVLRRAAVLDRPNQRSSHSAPTPRGGGIAVTAAILLAWLVLILDGVAEVKFLAIGFGGLLLAAVSGVDDIRSLPQLPRLLAQLIAVAIGMVVLAPLGPVVQGWLPAGLDHLVTALLWIWFVNLFNFMDGIDGIAGSEAAAIAVGLVVFASLGVGVHPALSWLAAPICTAALGFLVWNWAPARIFLGDVGSIPLGYLLGFLLLSTAARGHWKIALILPLYFLADATITLGRRLMRGEKIWQAHRSHFYQRATQQGLGHAAVVWRVIAANIMLIACGWMSENGFGLASLAIAAATVTLLILDLAGIWRRVPA
jgi:UDP-N-acetylmuramyl pentapeptide phosphotransferase/UDP-N-acetylglucosamine-1-phosphate transferase